MSIYICLVQNSNFMAATFDDRKGRPSGTRYCITKFCRVTQRRHSIKLGDCFTKTNCQIVTHGIGWLWWFKEPYWLLLIFTVYACLSDSCDALPVYHRIQNPICWGYKNVRNSWSKLKHSFDDTCILKMFFFPAQEPELFFSFWNQTRFFSPTWLQGAWANLLRVNF